MFHAELTTFKMAIVRHLEFSKFTNFHMSHSLLSDFTSSHKIPWISENLLTS